MSPVEESSEEEDSEAQTTEGDTLALAGQPSEINLDKVRVDLTGSPDSAINMSSFTCARQQLLNTLINQNKQIQHQKV